jgi:hypothetical protein
MNELVILNSIDDAKDCFSKGLYKDRYLFTTHVSVNIFLKEVYDINSTCIDSIFSDAELKKNYIFLSKLLDKILMQLDNSLASDLNEKYGLNIKYFYPLYSYTGINHISALFYFKEAFKIIIEKYSIEKIFLYNFVFNKNINGKTDTHSILSFLYPELEIEIIELNNKFIKQFPKALNGILFFYKTLYSVFRNVYFNPKILKNRVEEVLYYFFGGKQYDPLKKTILLHEPLSGLSFLKKKLAESYNIFYFSRSTKISQLKSKSNKNDAPVISDLSVVFDMDELVVKEPVALFFVKDIQKDINNHIDQYVSEVQEYIDNMKNKVSLGVWGTPPVDRARCLLFEHLTAEGVPVVGTQHGASYGDTIHPLQFRTDYNRCDYYFTWGFSNSDMKRLYPDTQSRCSVVPVGCSKQIAVKNYKKKIDILFPLRDTPSTITLRLARMSPSNVAIRQMHLLEYLNSIKDIKVMLKPMRGSNFEKCGSLFLLKRLNRLHFDNTIDLNSYLQKKTPRAVLIEIPSTPLYECLNLDIEIFLMNDPIRPLEEYALKAICKRVHYAESTEEMIKKMNLFFSGRLETKRDNSFFNHYVYRKDTKKNILNQIDKIIQA